MRITFDGRSLLSPWTGIQFYLLELIKAFNDLDKDVKLNLYLGSRLNISRENILKIEALSNVDIMYKPIIRSLADRLMRVKAENININSDIFHEMDIYKIPVDQKSILTVHDVIPKLYPEYFPENLCKTFSDVIGFNLKKATHVIADSIATKETLAFFFNIDPKNISVVYAGISDSYRPITNEDEIKIILAKYKIPKKYLLYLGTIEPRKNLVRVLQAYKKIEREISDTKLVICGNYGWKSSDVYRAYEDLNLKGKVIFTGYVDAKDKPAIYSGATAFVFPSIHEGFGFPPLESMACGTPVVTSNRSSLPEIVGDAAIQVDPYQTDEISDAMLRLTNDSSLNQDLTVRGLARASQFTWPRTAAEIMAVYKRINLNHV